MKSFLYRNCVFCVQHVNLCIFDEFIFITERCVRKSHLTLTYSIIVWLIVMECLKHKSRVLAKCRIYNYVHDSKTSEAILVIRSTTCFSLWRMISLISLVFIIYLWNISDASFSQVNRLHFCFDIKYYLYVLIFCKFTVNIIFFFYTQKFWLLPAIDWGLWSNFSRNFLSL